jgi:hypothetical protein
MTAYKVILGYETDFYGHATDKEIAKFFFDKEKALELYNAGKVTYEVVVTYTKGSSFKVETSFANYERCLKDKKENETIVIETRERNKYKFEEITIE